MRSGSRSPFAATAVVTDPRLRRDDNGELAADLCFLLGDLGLDLRRVQIVEARAELAGDADAAVVAAHVLAILRREAAHHAHDALMRAGAFLMHVLALEDAHAP